MGAQQPAQGDIEIIPVRPNFYMLAGAGANIGVLVGPDGFVVVDTGNAAATDKVLAAINQLGERYKTTVQGAEVRPRIRYICDRQPSSTMCAVGRGKNVLEGGVRVAEPTFRQPSGVP